MIFARRPKISIEAPPEAIPGKEYRARVFVRVRAPLELASLRASIEGRESVPATGVSRVLVAEATTLSGPATLAPGVHEFEFSTSLPSGLPPSMAGRGAGTEYRLRVHVEGRDGATIERSFSLAVAPPPAADPPDERVSFAAEADGVAWGTGRISGNLGGATFAPGESIVGEVTVATSFAGYFHRATASLVQIERYFAPDGTSIEALYPVAWVSIAPLSGLPREFRIDVPRWVAPSARSPSWELSWAVEISFDVHRRTCRLPITIVRPARSPSERAGFARPFVSAELGSIWTEVAREVGMTLDGGVLVGRARAVSARIHRERRTGDRIHLVALLGYPSLGLSLTIARGARRHRSHEVRIGSDAWDVDHRVHARDRDQALSYLRRIEKPLKGLCIPEMTDERAVAEQRLWVHERFVVGNFAWRVMELARAIDSAFVDPPPPTRMAPHVDAWKQLALLLDATLDVARMAMIGRYRGHEVEIRTVFGAAASPAGTRVVFHPSGAVDATPSFLEQIPPASIADQVRTLMDRYGALHVSARAAPLIVELPPVTSRPDELLGVLHILEDVASTLAPAAVPYR